MQTILTLITPPAGALLDAATVTQFGAAINAHDVTILKQGIACEWQGEFNSNHVKVLRQLIDTRPIDIAMTPTTHRRKKLLIADMDSTMIEQECIDELADSLGLREKISAITERAMNGELDFRAALDERVGLLTGLTLREMANVRDTAITKTNGGATLLQTMKKNDGYSALVSGGFTFFADEIARELKFDECTANQLLIANEQLTGKVGEPIVDKDTKKQRLLALTKQQGLSLAQTMAVGDGANDLEMLRTAGIGVAFYAKPSVAVQADVRIDHCDLSALLYIQGYKSSEFVT